MPKLKHVLLLIQPTGSFGRGILSGISEYANTHGPWSFFHQTEQRKFPHHYLRNFVPDGIIFDVRQFSNAASFLQAEMPYVAVNCSADEGYSYFVESNSQAIAEMCADHLLHRGFKQFAYCSYTDMNWSCSRYDAFKLYIEKMGYQTHFFGRPYKTSNTSWEREIDMLSKWLQSLPKPIGIMACNDDRGRHVLEAAKEVGIHVPEEIAVIGVDNDEIVCNLTYPPLSSVALNSARSGYEMAETLDSLMNHKPMEKKRILVLPSHVVTRQSTDCLAIQDQEVASAIRFIREHSHKPIQVIDVVEALSVSRRVLERRFKRSLHCSILDEIRRARIAGIENALIHSRLSISDISNKWGFSCSQEFCRYFSSARGISPSQFRKEYSSLF